ncbi:MAG: SDR family NAD(P)-dependent oxidoreductase [Myxococcales bacterium]|nr:SDR family NAD(P)-dependent oxidoreductase [Myxococcales bacterium]
MVDDVTASVPDSRGGTPTCLVTGANAGIGRAAAIELARAGCHVLLGCRSRERGEAAVAEVRARAESERVELAQVDLSLRASVRALGAELRARLPALDVLIHNAAAFDLAQREREVTSEGVETHWATNHLGPVALTDELRPLLAASAGARVVTVSSKGLQVFPCLRVHVDDPEFRTRRFSVPRAYYQSKLAQEIYTRALADELAATRITVHCVRVTNVRVDLARYPDLSAAARFAYGIKRRFAITPEAMAQTYCWLALAGDARARHGQTFDERQRPVRPVRGARDVEHAAAVMALTRRYLDAAPAA